MDSVFSSTELTFRLENIASKNKMHLQEMWCGTFVLVNKYIESIFEKNVFPQLHSKTNIPQIMRNNLNLCNRPNYRIHNVENLLFSLWFNFVLRYFMPSNHCFKISRVILKIVSSKIVNKITKHTMNRWHGLHGLFFIFFVLPTNWISIKVYGFSMRRYSYSISVFWISFWL